MYALTKPNIFYKGTPQVILKPAGDALRTWHPEYYSHDFDLARQIGMNCFRISLEWARIEPERGQWNQDAVDHYKVMIKHMQEEGHKKGLRPIITLNHLALPLWVLIPPYRRKDNRSRAAWFNRLKRFLTCKPDISLIMVMSPLTYGI